MKKVFRLAVVVFVLIHLSFNGSAQQSLINVTGWNAYVHLPSTYANNPTKKYPTIIFFPGLGEVGTNANAVISNGPGAYIAMGWNGNVNVDGNTVEFIVISLQTAQSYPVESTMNDKIQILKSLYRIDPDKLYLTGLSHGGWCSSTFVSGDNYGGPYTYASQIAAVVTVEGVQPADNQPYPNMMDNFAWSGGRYLGFEQVNDFRDTKTVVDRMNATVPNSAIYVKTNFGGGGHCCWSYFYGGQGRQPENFVLDGISQNIYQWMARQTRGSTPPAANQVPIANAGNDISIQLPANSTTLVGSGTDADGTIASYQWTKISGPTAGTITNPTAATTTITGLVQGTYVFQLKVTDNIGAIATDNMTVTVLAANQPPVANAGNDKTIQLPTNSTTLTGSGTDADGTIASYLWTKISGPSGGTISSPNAATTSITGLVQGAYIYQLKVTDNKGATATDNVSISVNAANQPPSANAGNDITIQLPTNSTTLSGSGSDADGSVASYQWTKILGPSGGTITSPTAATTTLTGLVQGNYQFQLKVTDNNGATATDNVIVIVQAANQPPVANAGNNITITLPTNSVVVYGVGTDPDGSITSYLWTKISGPAGGNIVSPGSGTTTINGLNQGTYQFQLKVTDNQGATSTDVMIVQVNAGIAGNQLPIAVAGNDISITLPTNQVSVSAAASYDPDGTITAYNWTSISGPAPVQIANEWLAHTSITFSTSGVYLIRLDVGDNNGAIGRDTLTVFVNPAASESNTPPVALAGNDIVLQLPANTTVLNGGNSFDASGAIVSYTWTQVGGTAPGVTITSPNSSSTSVSFSNAGTYTFRLKVTDNGGLYATDDIVVSVLPEPTATDKIINVNLTDAINVYNNPEWNNWAITEQINTTSAIFKYSNGSPSAIRAVLSYSARMVDNGTGYASSATMCPSDVLRFNSLSSINRYITLYGLVPGKTYDLSFFASRAFFGTKTIVAIGTRKDTIDTDYNTTDYAKFNSVTSDANGTLRIGLTHTGTWQYIAGFSIKENLSDNKMLQPENSFNATSLIGKNNNDEVYSEKAAETAIVFPNPFNDKLSVRLGAGIKGNYKLVISTVTGATLLTRNGNKTSETQTDYFQTATLPGGIYLLQVINNGTIKTYKLIKN
ncbi:MAG: tandem-95 repeat protein [Bacteroidetes bacterium]|nr:tandem-95 repeat protein [Bacteroidota bacterium]